MNANRRKRITEVVQKLGACISEIEAIKDEEQEAFDAMPESIQQGERGESSQSAQECLESAEEYANGAVTQLEEIQ